MENYGNRETGARYRQTDYDQILSVDTIRMGVVMGERGILFVKTGQVKVLHTCSFLNLKISVLKQF